VEVLYQFWPRGTTISHGGENRYTEEVAEAFDSSLRRVHCRLNTVAWSHRNTATFCTQSQESFNQDDRWTGPWPPARSAPNRKPGSPTIVAVRKHTRKATTSKAGGATTRPGPPGGTGDGVTKSAARASPALSPATEAGGTNSRGEAWFSIDSVAGWWLAGCLGS
jgi:hypothetical protein